MYMCVLVGVPIYINTVVLFKSYYSWSVERVYIYIICLYFIPLMMMVSVILDTFKICCIQKEDDKLYVLLTYCHIMIVQF